MKAPVGGEVRQHTCMCSPTFGNWASSVIAHVYHQLRVLGAVCNASTDTRERRCEVDLRG